MKQWTHALRTHLSDFFLWRGYLRTVRRAVILAEDQRRSSRLLLLLRRNGLQRWRNRLLHQLVLYPLRRVEKVRVDFAVVVGRSCRPDTDQLADIANIFLWREVRLMVWQFGLGVRRRRLRNELEIVKVLG